MGPSDVVPVVSEGLLRPASGGLTRPGKRLLEVLKVHVRRQVGRPGLFEDVNNLVLLERLLVSQSERLQGGRDAL